MLEMKSNMNVEILFFKEYAVCMGLRYARQLNANFLYILYIL